MYTEGVYVVWSGEIIPGAPCMNCCNLILPHPVYYDSAWFEEHKCAH